jgi:phosphate starvation-inducible PhoH-like protein
MPKISPCDDNEEPLGKQRTRKPRKQNDKEIRKEYKTEIENEQTLANQKQLFENLHHLSAAEKSHVTRRFTQPKNESQQLYVSLLSHKSKKIVVATGPAGTGKTLFATEYGIRNFLAGQYERLIFTRPSVSVDEDLGYLPGTLEEKMAPWIRPIYDILYQHISPKDVTALVEDKVIEIAPLGYMRGRTFKNCWIVADEMQNSTLAQMKMLMTRLGENSRLIITGDLEQYDRDHELNGLEDFLQKFRGKRSSSISSFEFQRSDIQREDVVREVLDIYGGDVPPCYQEEKEDA